MGASLSIGTVAAMSGLTRDAIRYYERRGLLPAPARTPAGYRRYGEGVVRRLALIRNAQRFGFSLAAIASFLRVREAGGRPCESVRAAAQQMLDAMDVQFAELSTARTRMRRTLHHGTARWRARRRLARPGCSSGCPAMPHTRARSALPARMKETYEAFAARRLRLVGDAVRSLARRFVEIGAVSDPLVDDPLAAAADSRSVVVAGGCSGAFRRSTSMSPASSARRQAMQAAR